jgi:hypothetical protein
MVILPAKPAAYRSKKTVLPENLIEICAPLVHSWIPFLLKGLALHGAAGGCPVPLLPQASIDVSLTAMPSSKTWRA